MEADGHPGYHVPFLGGNRGSALGPSHEALNK
jgi:hypothetical protein